MMCALVLFLRLSITDLWQIYPLVHLLFHVKALIQAELQDSKADDRAPKVDDKAAGKRHVV